MAHQFAAENDIPKPLRLIQYLGSKLRSLDDILPVIIESTPKEGVLLDLFAGTTVVGQGAISHCSVFSNDSLAFSSLFADVLISQRPPEDRNSQLNIETLFEVPEYARNKEILASYYEQALELESEILLNGDGKGLGKLAASLPHFWKKSSHRTKFLKTSAFLSQLDFQEKRMTPFSEPACLATSYYAANYFGIKQCIEIDSLRLSIEACRNRKVLTGWQASAFLAALLAACSRAVSTAGKHFAQPLILNSNGQRPFAISRALEDRKVSVPNVMQEYLIRISQSAEIPRKSNRSYQVKFEEIMDRAKTTSPEESFKHFFGVERVNTIYADPPYTAQQYSRFYHILETLLLYDYPFLQPHRTKANEITQGIYRTNRHNSIFCSKSKSVEAFEFLFRLSKAVSDTLVLSYSETKESSGNPRMIAPDTLVELASKVTSKMEVRFLSHSYRRLNRTAINKKSNDREKLFVFRFR